MAKEIWRLFSENPNYEVSNQGRVKSKISGKLLKELPGTNGYTKYCLQGKWYSTHRLVAIVFIPNPDEGTLTQVNHIDGNKHNNKTENLEWVSPSTNINHAYKNRLIEVRRGKEHHGYGKPLSDEHKRKVSESNKGRKKTVEHRRKLGRKVKVTTFEEEEIVFATVKECSESLGINYWYLTKILQGRAPSRSEKHKATFEYLDKEVS